MTEWPNSKGSDTNYAVHMWPSYMCIFDILYTNIIIGIEKEGESEKLRSVLSQLEYTHQVLYWDEHGVPFKTYFYVPEVHPITKSEYHEREDDAHVLKVHKKYLN